MNTPKINTNRINFNPVYHLWHAFGSRLQSSQSKLYCGVKKINLIVLGFVLVLFGYYIYQNIFISSGKVSLVNLKKEFLERKNNLDLLVSAAQSQYNFDPDLIKKNFKMAEIEKFDYLIIGPSEFALIGNRKFESQQ